MYFKKKVIGLAIVLGICAFINLSLANPAESAEQVYDVDVCVSMELTPLVQSEEISIFTFDCKGIMRSNIESKVFDNCTAHVLGVMVIEGENRTYHSYLIYLAPDGDHVIFRFTQNPGEEAATTTLLVGTGKWKGITGGGKAVTIAKGIPVVKGTFQFCNNHKGKFTVPTK